jgi:hypothetical protein
MESLDEEVCQQVKTCKLRIADLPGKHVAIQALWDGDTEGWFINIELVTAKGGIFPWPKRSFTSHPLTTLRYGGDFRVFSGAALPWLEAAVAERVGTRLAETHRIPFYFPSPQEPDNDCPPWWLRDSFNRCQTCGKSLHRVLQYGPPSSRIRDQCASCEGEAKHRRELLEDAPGSEGNRGVFLFFPEPGTSPKTMWLNLGFEDDEVELCDNTRMAVAKAIDSMLRLRTPAATLSEHIDGILTAEEIAVMVHWCEGAVDAALSTYKPSGPFSELIGHFTQSFMWRGLAHSVETYFDEAGNNLFSLVGWHEFFTAGASAGLIYIVGNGGITQRDVTILARYKTAGGFSIPEMHQEFSMLPADAVNQTLAKLEERGFLICEKGTVRFLAKGLVVTIAGPP